MSFYFHPRHGMVAVESHFLQSSLQDEENPYVFVFFFGRQINGGRSQRSFLNYRSFWGRQSQSVGFSRQILAKFSLLFVFFFSFWMPPSVLSSYTKSTRTNFIVPRALAKAGDIKTHSSVLLSLCPSVRPSVCHKNFNLAHIFWSIKDIEHWYLACMVLVTSPFNWHQSVTLTFDLFQGQICCRAGDHNSPILLVLAIFPSVKFFGQAFSFFYCSIRLNFRLNVRKGTK